MHYRVAGDGPALALLHGWPQTGYCWRHLVEPLAERYTVVVPDLRGYGKTDKSHTGFDKRTMAEDVRQLVRALGFESAALVGHDRGAFFDFMTGDEKFADERPDYLLFSQTVVPALLEAGVAQEQIDTMLVEVPARFFG